MIKALVVEDEADISDLLAEQVKDKGCRVQKAGNGKIALHRISAQTPDVILVDIMMPVMDGIELIAELQKNPKMNQIPVVLVTAVSTPEVTMRAVELGVKFRLAKPWEQSALDFVFESALNLNKVS
ncbi:MAG: response regulator [Dehalococcoidia bacterium]|nr:response regulator [Dehalococcoidia bacterium]